MTTMEIPVGDNQTGIPLNGAVAIVSERELRRCYEIIDRMLTRKTGDRT